MKRSQQATEPLRSYGCQAILVACLLFTGSLLEAEARPLVDFEVEDQFGRIYSASDFAETAVILIGGDRSSRQGTRSWAIAVGKLVDGREEFEDRPRVIRVADLRGVPKVFRPRVVKQVQRGIEVSLLLDWDGQIAESFEFKNLLTNVILIDAEGLVRVRLESAEPLAKEIDILDQSLTGLTPASSSVADAKSRAILLGSCL